MSRCVNPCFYTYFGCFEGQDISSSTSFHTALQGIWRWKHGQIKVDGALKFPLHIWWMIDLNISWTCQYFVIKFGENKQTNANGLVMFIASSPIFTDPRTPEKDLSAALEVVAMSTEVKTWVMNRFEFKSQISYLNIGWGWLNDISCHNISIINWNKKYIYIPYCSHLWLNIVKWLNGNIHQPGIFIPNVHDLQPEISYPIISQTWIHSILFMKIFHQLETVRYFNGRLP